MEVNWDQLFGILHLFYMVFPWQDDYELNPQEMSVRLQDLTQEAP